MNHWLVTPKKLSAPAVRLFCFPYAGGGTRTYLPWANRLPDGVELVAVQPPGRGVLFAQPAFNTMDALVDALFEVMRPYLDRPYVLLGHSLGSRVAFAWLLKVQAAGLRLPELFIASGSNSPDTVRQKPPLHALPDAEFIAALRALDGTPAEVLDNPELMALLLPLLRADFQIAEQYRFSGQARLPCQLHVFGGRDDRDVPIADLAQWQQFFGHNAQVQTFDGGHFFIETQQQEVLSVIVSLLTQLQPLRLSGQPAV